ncbi:hypothetical protein [Cupriavidus sp. DF5525]|uniref:hypothetical protein n=1 Tax=Cupriavidus sp. DF5525 TaxID=3160989 RepID=UPI0032DEBA1F
MTAEHVTTDMQEYFHNAFPRELARLTLRRPSGIVAREIMEDNHALFFGGEAWASVVTDLAGIPRGHRTNFVHSLFMITLTDQCLYTYRRDLYPKWRARTRFPKFGWSGFGPHHENPLYLLWAPERDGLIDTKEAVSRMPRFVAFLVAETQRYFESCGFDLDVRNYMRLIREDTAYNLDKGVLIPCFKQAFERVAAEMDL